VELKALKKGFCAFAHPCYYLSVKAPPDRQNITGAVVKKIKN